MDLHKIKLFVQNRNFIPVLIFIIMDIITLAFVVYIFVNVQAVYTQREEAQTALEGKKGTAELIQANQQQLTSRVEKYNTVLNELVPDEESYFSVIAAFEQLAARTGVEITSYNINLSQTTEEKLSLNLSLVGDLDSILTLLETYNYASGRLLTNEGVDLQIDDTASVAFTVNLIHAKTQAAGVDTTVTISPQDMAFMEEIMGKI